MKTFSCSHCGQTVFFENTVCVNCGHELGYDPERMRMLALKPVEEEGRPESLLEVMGSSDEGRRFKHCANRLNHGVCNWLLPEGEEESLCESCQLTLTIPSLDDSWAALGWSRMEIAKRRLLYGFSELGLKVYPRDAGHPYGLGFEFLMNEPGGPEIKTGHREGLITVDIAEADDVLRTMTRTRLGEDYRTLLGHFRHESGHFWWDQWIKDSERLSAFRECFGDERYDYKEALDRYYRQGPWPDWSQNYMTAYASSHPWEDWAETWAHYMHLVDTVETAQGYGMSLLRDPASTDGLSIDLGKLDRRDFDALIDAWVPVTMALNSFNRSMGLPDLYPFSISQGARRKLAFIHRVVAEESGDNRGF